MASSSEIFLALIVALAIAYFGRRFIFGSAPQTDGFTAAMNASAAHSGEGNRRDIVAKMEKNGRDVVVFYGSQTGTAEDLASKLAKDLSAKFGLKAMTADLEDYDFENLDTFSENNIAIFMMASYGEGEPTDNAVDFWSFLVTSDPEFSNGGTTLENLHFAVFGLGNNTYEKFNEIGRELNKRLESLGAHRIGEYGEGDDADGATEEDFLAWKETLLHTIKVERGLEEHEYVYEPAISVEDAIELSSEDPSVFLGEPNKNYLEGTVKSPFNHLNPYLSSVTKAKELFNSKDRNCVHLEFDLADSGLRYTTGDHLAFYAQNSDETVDELLKILGLTQVRHDVINIKALDATTQIRIPSPTTYDTVVRYFLEINGPLSRQVLSNFASFAPTEEAKQRAKALGNDKVLFHKEVSEHYFNLAHLLSRLSGGKPWSVPFSFIIESLPHLQPRYYSISSSSGEDKSTISITAVVERSRPAGSDFELKGVATNEIFDILGSYEGSTKHSYQLAGPRGAWSDGQTIKVPVSVRHSNFKLPSKSLTPIIMVGPGTGVAPFRGFIHERAVQAQTKPVGKALLFYGCRRREEDALYADEWPTYSSPETVGQIEGPFKQDNFLEVVNAFSRETNTKVYVQQRLKEHGKIVNQLLEQGAYFFVCGDASHMAREVQNTLAQVISEHRGITIAEADQVIKKMKVRSFYQEDVW